MGFFHLIDKIADFLHNKLFFSDSPEGFALLLESAQPCADRLRTKQHLFEPLGMP